MNRIARPGEADFELREVYTDEFEFFFMRPGAAYPKVIERKVFVAVDWSYAELKAKTYAQRNSLVMLVVAYDGSVGK